MSLKSKLVKTKKKEIIGIVLCVHSIIYVHRLVIICCFTGTLHIVSQVVDLSKSENPPVVIRAHQGKISCLALDLKGELLATASDKVIFY